MRVYDLARTLDIKSKELLLTLKKLRIGASTASSAVEDKDVQRVMAYYKKEQQSATPGAPLAEEKTLDKTEAGKRRLNSALESARQRIEMLRAKKVTEKPKEKKTGKVEEQAAQERARRSAAREERIQKLKVAQGLAKLEEAPEAAAVKGGAPAALGAKPAAPAADRKPKRMRKKDRQAAGQAADGKLVVPDIQVMRMDKNEFRGRRRPEAVGRKKKGKIKPTKIIRASDVRTGARPRGPGVGRRVGGRRGAARGAGSVAYTPTAPVRPKLVSAYGEVTVGELAEKALIPVGELMKTMLMMGETYTINDILPKELCELIAEEFEFKLELIPDTDESDIAPHLTIDDPAHLTPRPPIVTIMGHVDHGKTTLLDAYRKSNVVGDEVGGITQRIGAYYVHMNDGMVAFLDTPGHAAFTAMRARGAQVTDIVVLVVAANDSVMPQTIEAINHAKAAKVPIVVAVNKTDLPDANPLRVRQELMAYGLTSEEFGGDTIFVDISAKTKTGIDKLFDMIILQAEVLELKADAKRMAEGFIIESHLNPARGAVATVLITAGTLKVGDIFVAGDISGRVRRMRDEHDQLLTKAGPSRPVELIGLSGAPEAGEHFVVMADERIAREIADKRNFRRRVRQLGERQHVTLENLHEHLEEGKIKELNLVLKGDLQGSLEAIQQSLRKLPAEKVKVNFIHSGVGPINESDVNLAMTTDSIIFGFNIRPEAQANLLAKNKGIDIRLYRVIYDLLGDIEKALLGMLEPTYRELPKGRAEVRQVFKLSKFGQVAGCFVAEGEMLRGAHGRLMRDSAIVYDGKIASLRRVKDDVAKVAVGLECGVQLENYQDVKEGDIIECYELEELTQGL